MFRSISAFLLLSLFAVPAMADSSSALRDEMAADLSHYVETRGKIEHISAASLSVALPREANIDVAVGRTSYGGGGRSAITSDLFQIGSVTKSFTAAEMLQLEAEGELSIDQTVGRWLPQYPAWKNITIRRLLNMTGQIPTYDDYPSMLGAYAADPMKDWTPQQLVAVVYPAVKPDAAWLYSNTGYALCEMIVERATGKSYAEEIRHRFLNNPAIGLSSTYYEPHLYPSDVAGRLVSGYFASTDSDNAALAPILYKDVRGMSVSWARSAGGIVSTPDDVTRWVRALFGGSVLPRKQRQELMTEVSMASGKPLTLPTPQDSRGFGLGVGEILLPKIGLAWFYEGMTLGYRMTYVYLPRANAVIAVGLNSQPNKKDDDVGKLMTVVYDRLHAAGKL